MSLSLSLSSLYTKRLFRDNKKPIIKCRRALDKFISENERDSFWQIGERVRLYRRDRMNCEAERGYH